MAARRSATTAADVRRLPAQTHDQRRLPQRQHNSGRGTGFYDAMDRARASARQPRRHEDIQQPDGSTGRRDCYTAGVPATCAGCLLRRAPLADGTAPGLLPRWRLQRRRSIAAAAAFREQGRWQSAVVVQAWMWCLPRCCLADMLYGQQARNNTYMRTVVTHKWRWCHQHYHASLRSREQTLEAILQAAVHDDCTGDETPVLMGLC
jgi:hypothetical protein